MAASAAAKWSAAAAIAAATQAAAATTTLCPPHTCCRSQQRPPARQQQQQQQLEWCVCHLAPHLTEGFANMPAIPCPAIGHLLLLLLQVHRHGCCLPVPGHLHRCQPVRPRPPDPHQCSSRRPGLPPRWPAVQAADVPHLQAAAAGAQQTLQQLQRVGLLAGAHRDRPSAPVGKVPGHHYAAPSHTSGSCVRPFHTTLGTVTVHMCILAVC